MAAVYFVRVEGDCIRSCRNPNEPVASRLNQAPGSGHGNKVAPGIQHVAIPVKIRRVFLMKALSSILHHQSLAVIEPKMPHLEIETFYQYH